MLFVVAIALLAGIPLLRTALIGKLNAKVIAEERNYETNRAKKEESMFHARSFFRLNGLVAECLERFHQDFTDWFHHSGKKKISIKAVQAVLDYLCDYGTSLGAIFVGSILVLMNKMSVGALMLGYLLLPTLTSFYRNISSHVEEIQQERDAQERLAIFYGMCETDLESTECNLPLEAPAVERICLDHVTFTYPGEETPAVKDWSGSFSSSGTFRLIGRNGSGKTTLARLVTGLYAPQAGAITDEKGTPLSKEALRSLTTLQEQDGSIFQGTVWDNLFIGENKRTQAQAYLDALGFEKPLEYPVVARARNLSPGERQKILLARSLLRETKFLVVDEPLNNMDAAGARNLLAQLRERQRGLILISHQDIALHPQITLTLGE